MKHAQLAWFRQQQQQALDTILPHYKGYELVLLGHDELLPVKESPIQHMCSVVRRGKPKVALVSDYESLPLPNQFVDVVVAWHVFDTHPDPRALFREVYRVLRRDGILVILGAHRPRIAAATISRSEQYHAPKGGLHTVSALKLAAYDVGLQIDRISYFAGVRYHAGQSFRQNLDQFVCRVLPCLALGYCLVLKKQMIGLTPLKETWTKEKVALNKRQVPTTYQQKCSKKE